MAAVHEAALAATVAFYFSASFRDPGYAPLPSEPRTRRLALEESLLPAERWCQYCGAAHAPRTKHCRDCCEL